MPWIGPAIGAVAGLVGNSMSSGGNTQTTQNSVPPEFSGLASAAAQRGQQIGNMPYTPYPYAQTADFNPYQYMGFDMQAANAMQNPLPGAATGALTNQLMGGNNSLNPYAGAQTQVGQNPYAGSNPYLEGVIGNTLGDMSNQFNMNVVPTETARGLASGSFGNSGLAQRADQNRYDLAQAQGQVAGNLRMQDYTGQQGLAENALNRNVTAQQTDLNRNAGLYESAFNRNQAGLFGALGQAGNVYNLGQAPGQTLQGIGSTMQQQAQNTMNPFYSQFQESQQWPFKTYQAMLAPFGQNIGGQQTVTGPGQNPVAGLMGGAMLGNQIGKGFQTQNTQFGGQGYTGMGTPVDQWSGMGYY